jgi:hypothetical protein
MERALCAIALRQRGFTWGAVARQLGLTSGAYVQSLVKGYFSIEWQRDHPRPPEYFYVFGLDPEIEDTYGSGVERIEDIENEEQLLLWELSRRRAVADRIAALNAQSGHRTANQPVSVVAPNGDVLQVNADGKSYRWPRRR